MREMRPSDIALYEKVERALSDVSSDGWHPGLERVSVLLEALGTPQAFPAIHLAGTNGKGSTAAFLESIYRAAGYKTALYTSPHLIHLGERLLVNGYPLPPELWAEASQKVAQTILGHPWLSQHRPTYFETLTAAAYLLVRDAKPDVAIIETGMGGRLDATNILPDCRLAVITPIDWDHMAFLGNTLSAIASEKFGIIVPSRPAIFSDNHPELAPEFRACCAAKNSPAYTMDECRIFDAETSLDGCEFSLTTPCGTNRWFSRLLGTYQPENASLALRATEILQKDFPVTEEARREGLRTVRWPGRLEVVSRDPDVILDGAHNPHGMKALTDSLLALYGKDRLLTVVFTAMADKDYAGEFSYMSSRLKIRLICTRVSHNTRCESAQVLAQKATGYPFIDVPLAVEDPVAALEKARGFSDPVILCGSLYFIGSMRSRLVSSDEWR